MTAAGELLTRRLEHDRPWSGLIGLRSVFSKTVRDSRRAAIITGGLGGFFMFATAAPIALEFTTPESRAQMVATMTALPAVFRGLLGDPIAIDTLGGFMSWRVGNFLPVLLGLWSVIALSGTLAGEAASGSLDIVASTGHSRRSIAIQKVAGHVVAVAFAMVIVAILITAAGQGFAVLPGDEITPVAAFGTVVLYGLLMLASGAVAFVVGQFAGRSRGVAFGLVALFGMYLVDSYGTLSPALEAVSPISWFAWTDGHRPMAGVTDWPAVGVLAIVVVGLLGLGVAIFERRDIGAAGALAWLRLPSLPAGTGGVIRRTVSDNASTAIGWGIGVGAYAAVIASSAEALTASLNEIPGIITLINALYPDLDFSQPSGILQLAFFAVGSLMAGLAAASFLFMWAGDEGRRRLDLVLTTPTSRVGWLIRSGLGIYIAIGIFTLVLVAFVGIAVASQGGDVLDPIGGGIVLGLAATGFAGVGLAAGGLVRSSVAALVTGAIVIGTFVLDTFGAALDLPDVVLDLSIFRHLGQPMAGVYDPVGIVAAIVLAIGGLAVGALGMRRRDIGR